MYKCRSQEESHTLFESIDKFRTLVEKAGIGIYLLDNSGFIYTNRRLLEMFGYESRELKEKSVEYFIAPEEREIIEKKLQMQIEENIDYMDYIFRGVSRDGSSKYIHAYCTMMRSTYIENQKALMCILVDETNIIEANRELERLANYDTLTQIFNKRIFEEELDRILELAKRKGNKVALILFDIDHFKRINDSLGHKSGDLVLKRLTDKIKQILRKSELFARIGGDEFGLIVENFQDVDEIAMLLNRFQRALDTNILIDRISLRITISIGVALFPEHGRDRFTLFQAADTALYEAKKAGRNRYIFYDKNSKYLLESIKLGKELEGALRKNQMEINLQSQVSLRDNQSEIKVCCAEALIRWEHPKKGTLYPGDFLIQASKIGILYQLDLFALKSVLSFLKEIEGEKRDLTIAINISNALFHHQKFIDSIEELEEDFGHLFSKIELELDNKILQHSDRYSKKTIDTLNGYGFLFSIDDFGTGLTSFKALQDMKVNKINIDISFIKELESNHKTKAIVKAIIDMAHALDLTVLAKGVESRSGLEILKELGCDVAQGYYFSRPTSIENFKKGLI